MRRLILLTAVAAALVLPSAAGAVIIPQRSIASVNIGMSPYFVRVHLGFPLKIRHARNEFGYYTVYRYKGLIVAFQGGRHATAITTHSRTERTLSGVGVGSTESEVRAGVPGVTCKTEGGFRHCKLGKSLPGRRVTDFIFKKGVVGRVVVGRVID